MADVPAEAIVCLDETSTQTVMTRRRGRARAGLRVTERVPRNHGDNLTLLAAIGTDGVKAPLVFPRALDGELFAQWVRERLVPTLRPGQFVVLDNLSVHRDARARTAIEAAGCRLAFLPVSSPDLNPIELVFARVKGEVRGAKARTREAVEQAIGAALDQLTSAGLTACSRHGGYHVTGQPS
jgi:putative transposase